MRLRFFLLIGFAAVVLLGTSAARGELVQQDGLRVAFDGGFAPHALPRNRPAPVTVRIDGSVGTINGAQPPPLRQIEIAINRHGRLFTGGLPICPIGLLQSTSTDTALARCRAALVGSGSFGADVNFPSLPLFPVRGRLLAFNGRSGGRAAILLHLYISSPARVTLVVPFEATPTREGGEFGTIFSAAIPQLAGDLGYVTDLALKLGRTYTFRGRPRSLFSANCAAPPGFPGAIFAFARGSFLFADGKELTTTISRGCLVR